MFYSLHKIDKFEKLFQNTIIKRHNHITDNKCTNADNIRYFCFSLVIADFMEISESLILLVYKKINFKIFNIE